MNTLGASTEYPLLEQLKSHTCLFFFSLFGFHSLLPRWCSSSRCSFLSLSLSLSFHFFFFLFLFLALSPFYFYFLFLFFSLSGFKIFSLPVRSFSFNPRSLASQEARREKWPAFHSDVRFDEERRINQQLKNLFKWQGGRRNRTSEIVKSRVRSCTEWSLVRFVFGLSVLFLFLLFFLFYRRRRRRRSNPLTILQW